MPDTTPDPENTFKADLYYKLAQRARSRYETREQAEWRAALALWTLFAFGIGAMMTGTAQPSVPIAVILVLAAIVILGLYLYWQVHLDQNFNRDLRTSHFWESGLEKLLNQKTPDYLTPYGDWPRMDDGDVGNMGGKAGGKKRELYRGIWTLHRVALMEFGVASVLATVFILATFFKSLASAQAKVALTSLATPILNSVGLFLGIAGVVLIWWFGLPAKVDPDGHIHFIAEQTDESEIRKAKLYYRWSRTGLALVIAGFVCQFAANWL